MTFYILQTFLFPFLCLQYIQQTAVSRHRRGNLTSVGPRPDWSPLGAQFKISDEHFRPFHTGAPPSPPSPPVDMTSDCLQQFILSSAWKQKGESPTIFCCTGSRVRFGERIHRTRNVLTGIRFMTPICSCIPETTYNRPRDLYNLSTWFTRNIPCIFAV